MARNGLTGPVPIPPIIHSMRCFQFRRLFSAAALMPRDACGAKSTGNPAMTCWICRPDGRLGEDNTAFLCRSRCRRTFFGLCPMIIQVLPSGWPHLCGTGALLSLRGVRPCISICSRMEGTPEAKAQIEKTHFLKYGKKWGCETVRRDGLQLIRPRRGATGQYDLKPPYTGPSGEWGFLDAVTANLVCQLCAALPVSRQEGFKRLPAGKILTLCRRAADGA